MSREKRKIVYELGQPAIRSVRWQKTKNRRRNYGFAAADRISKFHGFSFFNSILASLKGKVNWRLTDLFGHEIPD